MEKWAIRRTKQTYKEINKYFTKLNNREYSATGTWEDGEGTTHYYDFLIFPHIHKSTFMVKEIPEGYTEITFDWFKEQILGQKLKTKKILYEIY